MSDKLISVVVPCYNESRTIEESLLSIINQKIPNDQIEIFVIDGMSTDGTRDILCKVAKRYNNFTIIDNVTGKTPVARNLGVKKSIGKYIAILDAHTVYGSDYLKNCIDVLESRDDIVCTGCPYISRGITTFGNATALAMSHPFGIGNAKHRYPTYEGFAEGAAFPVYRREVFEEVGLFDERLLRNQDDEFNFRLRRKNLKVYITPKNNCIYYVRETPNKLFRQYFEYGFWRVAVLFKHKIPISVRQVVPALFITGIFLSGLTGLFLGQQQLYLSLLIPILYIVSLLMISVPVIFKSGFKTGFLFIYSISILHTSYGLGFIKGLLSKDTRINDKELHI